MKAVFTLIAFLFLSTIALAHPTFPLGMVRIYVYSDGDKSPDFYGSGSIISPTQIITCHHVVQGRRNDPPKRNRSIQVRFADGSRSYASVVRESSTWDIALLTVHQTTLTPFTIGERPQSEQPVVIQGFGSDYEYVAGPGTVNKIFLYPEGYPKSSDFFRVDGVAARRGDSGGPITDVHGNLIGMLYAANWTSNYTVGVTVDRIQKVLGDTFVPSAVITDPNEYILQQNDVEQQPLRDKPMGAFRPNKSAYLPFEYEVFTRTRSN